MDVICYCLRQFAVGHQVLGDALRAIEHVGDVVAGILHTRRHFLSGNCFFVQLTHDRSGGEILCPPQEMYIGPGVPQICIVRQDAVVQEFAGVF